MATIVSVLFLALAIGFSLLTMSPSPNSHGQQPNGDKEQLLAVLRNKELLKEDLRPLMDRMRKYKVPYQLTAAEETEFRQAGAYLGANNIEALIKTIRENPRTQKKDDPIRANSTPVPQSGGWSGTDLSGIGETGVTAKVRVTRASGYDGNTMGLRVENTSSTGTITNIGVFAKIGKPTSGLKVTVPGEITPPGYYKFTNTDITIETPNFTAICVFALLTTGASSFRNGNVVSGIPPGQFAVFSFEYSNWGDLSNYQLEKGVIVRFQGIGKTHEDDFAIYPNLKTLFLDSGSIYQISAPTKK